MVDWDEILDGSPGHQFRIFLKNLLRRGTSQQLHEGDRYLVIVSRGFPKPAQISEVINRRDRKFVTIVNYKTNNIKLILLSFRWGNLGLEREDITEGKREHP